MIDRQGDALAAAVARAQLDIDAHHKDCADCSTARAARQPRLMCVPGWRLYKARLEAIAAQQAYVAEQQRLVESWPKLFDRID